VRYALTGAVVAALVASALLTARSGHEPGRLPEVRVIAPRPGTLPEVLVIAERDYSGPAASRSAAARSALN